MKKSIMALALALTLVGSLAACSNRDPNTNNNGSNGNNSGTTSGAASGSGSAGQVSRRYNTTMDKIISTTAATPPAPTARSTAAAETPCPVT